MTHFQFQQFFKIYITSHSKARAELLVSNKVFKLNNWSPSSLANASPLYLKTQGYCLQNDVLQLYFRLQDKNLLNIQSLLLLKPPISCKLIVSKGVQDYKTSDPFPSQFCDGQQQSMSVSQCKQPHYQRTAEWITHIYLESDKCVSALKRLGFFRGPLNRHNSGRSLIYLSLLACGQNKQA